MDRRILKNLEKYNDIKISKGIHLKTVRTTERDGYNGMSTERYGKKWFMLPKGRAIFKTYNDNNPFYNGVRNIRLVNELICQELAKQVNVLCAEYEPASQNGHYGLVTYDVAKPGEDVLNLREFYAFSQMPEYNKKNSFKKFVEAVDYLQEKGYKLNKPKMVRGFFKIALFDCLTAQGDRHDNNVLVLVDKDKKTVRLSPLIDNEFAYNIANLDAMISDDKDIGDDTFLNNLKYISYQLSMKEYDWSRDNDDWYDSNLQEIVKLVKSNKRYENIFRFMCSNINVENAMKQVEQKHKIKIGKTYKNYLINAERVIKNNIKYHLNNQVEKDNSYDFLSR